MNNERLARLAAALLLSLCAGCATQIPPLDPGEELAIISEKKAEAQVVNTDIGKGAAIGASVGTAGGLIVGSAAAAALSVVCGPFYALCMPGSIALFGVGGAVAGGIAGGAAGVIIGISEEKKKQLLANLAQIDAQRGLAGAVESRASMRWKLVPAPNEIIVRLDKLDLRATREKEVSLALTAVVMWKDKDDPRPLLKSYEYLGPATPLAVF